MALGFNDTGVTAKFQSQNFEVTRRCASKRQEPQAVGNLDPDCPLRIARFDIDGNCLEGNGDVVGDSFLAWPQHPRCHFSSVGIRR